jgi:hypothetical protein
MARHRSAQIGSTSAGREQALQLIGLFSVGGIHIDVQTSLDRQA